MNLTTQFHVVLALRISAALRLHGVGRNGFIPVLLHIMRRNQNYDVK